MCYSTARAATEGDERAMSRGVLIMLVPPVGSMTIGMGFDSATSKSGTKTSVGGPTSSSQCTKPPALFSGGIVSS